MIPDCGLGVHGSGIFRSGDRPKTHWAKACGAPIPDREDSSRGWNRVSEECRNVGAVFCHCLGWQETEKPGSSRKGRGRRTDPVHSRNQVENASTPLREVLWFRMVRFLPFRTTTIQISGGNSWPYHLAGTRQLRSWGISNIAELLMSGPWGSSGSRAGATSSRIDISTVRPGPKAMAQVGP